MNPYLQKLKHYRQYAGSAYHQQPLKKWLGASLMYRLVKVKENLDFVLVDSQNNYVEDLLYNKYRIQEGYDLFEGIPKTDRYGMLEEVEIPSLEKFQNWLDGKIKRPEPDLAKLAKSSRAWWMEAAYENKAGQCVVARMHWEPNPHSGRMIELTDDDLDKYGIIPGITNGYDVTDGDRPASNIKGKPRCDHNGMQRMYNKLQNEL